MMALSGVVVLATLCNPKPAPDVTVNTITPVELPIVVPGFNFPEDSNTIYSWLNNKNFPDNYDSASVYNHVWGIWAGLTAQSGQVYQGDSLRTFETWLGITDIRNLIINDSSGCAGAATKTMRAQLHFPHQFEHGFHTTGNIMAKGAMSREKIDSAEEFWVTVAYDPNAACYATTNKILKQSVLDSFKVQDAIGSVPKFPQKAITVKPTYFVGKEKGGLVKIPVWTGPRDSAQGYGFNIWPKVVYVDVKNTQKPGKKVIPVDTTASDIESAKVNLNDFIHFKLDSAMAAYMNASDSTEGVNNAEAGNFAILVAMHVTTKEISNWTWQTFYWAPDPDTPYSPSSFLARKLRPSQITGAATHYAAVSAYTMVLPNQPINGGTNTGVKPMIGYNPYLEAGFAGLGPVGDPNVDFNIRSVLIPGKPLGIQTNCMTCHSLATEDGLIGYSSDQYISMDSSFFKGRVQLDFAWSIQGNKISDKDLKKK